jgi:hypothetical protein
VRAAVCHRAAHGRPPGCSVAARHYGVGCGRARRSVMTRCPGPWRVRRGRCGARTRASG